MRQQQQTVSDAELHLISWSVTFLFLLFSSYFLHVLTISSSHGVSVPGAKCLPCVGHSLGHPMHHQQALPLSPCWTFQSRVKTRSKGARHDQTWHVHKCCKMLRVMVSLGSKSIPAGLITMVKRDLVRRSLADLSRAVRGSFELPFTGLLNAVVEIYAWTPKDSIMARPICRYQATPNMSRG